MYFTVYCYILLIMCWTVLADKGPDWTEIYVLYFSCTISKFLFDNITISLRKLRARELVIHLVVRDLLLLRCIVDDT